jgi:uncharacterized protein involved in exopolysaccharide biosynthesis
MDDNLSMMRMDEMNLFDYVLVLLKRKRMIIAVTVGITLATALVSLIVPKTYRAESTILVPSQNLSLSSQLLSQLSGATGLNLGAAAGVKTTGDLYVALLKSRPVLDGVIEKLRLRKPKESPDEAREHLLKQLKARDDKRSGIVTVSIVDNNPRRAADIANSLVDELKNLNRTLAVTEAGRRRLFYENQLKDVRESLLGAEESMKGFQERTGAIKIDDQARAVIQSIARLRAQVASREVQLRVARSYATRQNPEVQWLEEEVRGLKEQLGRLESKSGRGADPLVSTGRMPQLGTDYVRRMRELKFNEALYEILLKQFEVAKLDEARDAPMIQIIETAVPPEIRFTPRRAQMIVTAFVVSFFVAVLGAFFLEFMERSKQNPRNREQLEAMRRLAVSGWRRR